ncbi:MAG: M48 family metalloprotease [Candidatus Saccharicenans sp.]
MNIEFLQMIEVLNLTPVQITRNCFYGVVITVFIWLGITIILNFHSTSLFPKIVGAKRATDEIGQKLKKCIEDMSLASGEAFSKIKWYIMDSSALNAFACGRSVEKGSIVVTSSLINTLNEEELRAVIAHELAHLKNGDANFLSQAISFVWMVIGCGMAAYGLVTIAFVLIVALFLLIMKIFEDESVGWIFSLIGFILFVYALIYLGIYVLYMGTVLIIVSLAIKVASSSISKAREYLADGYAVQWTRNPVALASALQKVSGGPQIGQLSGLLISPLWLENPYDESKNNFTARAYRFLLHTHPTIESRLERVRAMAGSISHTDARQLLNYRPSKWQQIKNWLASAFITILAVFLAYMIMSSYFVATKNEPRGAHLEKKENITQEIPSGFINEPVVNVREGSGLNSRIIKRLVQNTPVRILKEQGDWLYVEWNESGQIKRGWVASRLINTKEEKNKQRKY